MNPSMLKDSIEPLPSAGCLMKLPEKTTQPHSLSNEMGKVDQGKEAEGNAKSLQICVPCLFTFHWPEFTEPLAAREARKCVFNSRQP